MGKPQSGQGPFHGGSSWETDHLCLQWTWLALHLGAVTWGHMPCTTPHGGACGHPNPQRDGGNSLQANQPTGSLPTPCCHPQVVYPIGLNGCDEPVITYLPEPLASGIHLTAGKPVYLEINILQLPVEDPDQKVAPLGEVSTIVVASPHKSIPQIRRRGQHDHGGKESPIPNSVGNVWLQIQKFNSKEA